MCDAYHRIVTNAYRKFVLLILVTTIPTGIIGIALNGVVDMASSSLLIPGICLIINAIVLLLVGSLPGGRKKVKASGYKEAAAIGIAQGIAVLPGISRSGSTISACLALGFDRNFAVKYSFIASLPAIIGTPSFGRRRIFRREFPVLYHRHDCCRCCRLRMYPYYDVCCQQ